MNKKQIFLFLFCVFLLNCTIAQVSVNPLTGAANVEIPIYMMRSGQTVLPVSLSYTGTGVKLKDAEGTAGMGWQLNTGGQVSRIVRGLPDDVTKDIAGNQRLGWMSSLDTAANKIKPFTVANDGSTCSKEAADITYITAHFPFRDDTEPDEFYVSAPGLSCRMIFNRDSMKFKPVNYQDLVINYTTDPTSHLITSFVITNDKGITYTFGTVISLAPAFNTVPRLPFPRSSAAHFITKPNTSNTGTV